MNLKQRIHRNPYLAILLVIFLGSVGGAELGWVYGLLRQAQIVWAFQREYPGGRMMCGTGIVDLPEVMALAGALVGLVIGTVLGTWLDAKFIQPQTMPKAMSKMTGILP
ncbi:MAG: hypothetical protein JST84_03960 [Acidobacteria bacterium]|nr:hypothetical protein [Acidobacteriota bacterium]